MVLPVILTVIGAGVVSLGAMYLLQPSLLFVAYMKFSRWAAKVATKKARVGKVTWVYSERGHPQPGVATMLMVHGFTSSRDSWNWVIKGLPSYVHIIAVDLPGHGDTEPDPEDAMEKPYEYYTTNLHQLMETIGLGKQPLHLVGLSMGGAIVGCYAAKYPENVRQVSFVCPAMATPVVSKMKEDEALSKNATLLPETVEELQKMMTYVVYKQMKFPKQFYKGMQELRAKHIPFFKLLQKRISETDGSNVLNNVMYEIKAPSHVVWGQEDYVLHVSGAAVLQEALPDCRQYDLIPECGHAIDLEKPELLTQRILAFWASLNKTAA